MKHVTTSYIIKQLRSDLIGKDSYRGVTLTYSWLANQFGHISLGFIPTFILYKLLSEYINDNNRAALLAATIISVLWLLFETYNFLGPLILKHQPKTKILFKKKVNYIFTPAWRNVAFDTLTDLVFFWFGAFLVGNIICFYSFNHLIILLILFVASIYPSYHWYLTKIYLQIPQYPFQFRLSQWDFDLREEDKTKVLNFIGRSESGIHILIFGGKGTGKTSLSVAMATELSISHKTCIYTTAIKLYSMFFEVPEKSKALKDALWNWRNTSTLVIDDINPGDPIDPDIVTPKDFLNLIDKYTSNNDDNRKILRSINTVWVLGKEKSAKNNSPSWKEMLKEIGVNEKKIIEINLDHGKI